MDKAHQPIDILLVEDSAGDARLTREALAEGKVANRLHVVRDGIAACDFLRHRGSYLNSPRPNLILLDLNLPRKTGHEVLTEIKKDEDLKRIPVIVLTTSREERDVMKSYDLYANCYLAKPVDVEEFLRVVRGIDDFWLSLVQLPEDSTP